MSVAAEGQKATVYSVYYLAPTGKLLNQLRVLKLKSPFETPGGLSHIDCGTCLEFLIQEV